MERLSYSQKRVIAKGYDRVDTETLYGVSAVYRSDSEGREKIGRRLFNNAVLRILPIERNMFDYRGKITRFPLRSLYKLSTVICRLY